MPHTVRQATIHDLEQLVPLFDSYRQFYGRASDLRAAREFLLARFHNDESTVFIAYQGESYWFHSVVSELFVDFTRSHLHSQ